MKQLLAKLQGNKRVSLRRRRSFSGSEWMKTQLQRMGDLNQGLIRMSGGR